MAALALRRDEASALAVAAVLHAALIGVLLLQPEERTPPPEPERVVVNLSEEVGLNSASPDPVAVSRAAEAPTFSELPAPPPPSPVQVTPPQETPRSSLPRPVTTTQTRPRPAPTSAPRPTPTRAARPAPAPTRAARPSPAPAPAPSPRATSGASRIGSDFLPGSGDSPSSSETRVPASQIGASARASLLSQIVREVRPRFDPPSGVDVEKLVSVVRFRLNADGSLNGRPSMISQSGVTDANSAQAGRHGELAVRAVVLAAPFDLPSQYHEAFKTVTLNFDASL